MKTSFLRSITALCLMILITVPLSAQENTMPAYLTVTTLYWNMDREESDNEADNNWLEIEKEYLEKVTKKNEHIMSASFYMHLYSPTNLESKYVQVYSSWEAIEKAQDRNVELEKMAWPDEAERKAFMANRQSFYQHFHSDEIMVPFAGAKMLSEMPSEDLVAYIRTSKMTYPDDGSEEEFVSLHKEFVDATVHTNDKVLAYYPNVHGWGSDRTDFVEAFYINSMDDLDDINDGIFDAIKAKWPDETQRNEFMKKYNRYFSGEHGDAIYTRMAALSK